MSLKYLCLLLLAASIVSATDAKLKCATVYDGLTNGKFDMKFQSSTTTIAANWFGFDDTPVLSYEWAVISEQKLPTTIHANSCVKHIRVLPDIQNWKSMQRSSQGINTNLKLQVGNKYYNLIRTTFATGEQSIAISDGVQVIEEESATKKSTTRNIVDSHTENITNKRKRDHQEGHSGASICAIDAANVCRKSQLSVADQLSELYGPPVFPLEGSQDILLFVGTAALNQLNQDDDHHGDDDDDEAPAWILAPVLVGSFLFYCLLAILGVLAMLLLKGKGPSFDRTGGGDGVMFNEQERETKAYGQREGMESVDATSETRVEFPDTNIRRLSISHMDAPVVSDAPDSGRGRKGGAHPIMSSASSSFRDYRSNVNH